MATNATTRKLMQAAKADVDEVMKRRVRALRARTNALKDDGAVRVMAAERAAAPPATPHMVLAAKARATTKGWLVAEGDSWFDYPGSDVLDWLQQFGYDVESVARAGDRAEMMAFGRGQLDKFAAAVEKVIGRGETPKAILLSAGGNDMAGTEFGFLLNHAGSPREGFNESIVTGVIDERVADAYLHIIARVTAVCEQMLGHEVPILLHGYGYVVPDGDGVLGGWGPLPGPWLRPGFIEKGFNNLAANTASMKKLMNRFNDMLERVAGQFGHVKYVNLRTVLPATKNLWANELHPKEQGFKLAAERFAALL
jgi:GDSL-like Lipase/Acylhydrolase family